MTTRGIALSPPSGAVAALMRCLRAGWAGIGHLTAGSAAVPASSLLALRVGELRSYDVHKGPGLCLACTHGVVWITHDHPPVDIVLCAGERVQITQRGKLVLTALEDARLQVSAGP